MTKVYRIDNQAHEMEKNTMKILANVSVIIVIIAMCCSAQQNYQPIPAPPGEYKAYIESFKGHVYGLDQLVRQSDLIIDATIGTVLRTIRMSPREPRFIETYTQISVNKVIRGELPKDTQSLAINEFGGNLEGYQVVDSNNSLVQPGEHYILFLKALKERKEFIVPDLGMPIYSIVGVADGKVKVTEKDTVQFHTTSKALYGSSEGSKIETFLEKLTRVFNIVDRTPTFPQGGSNPPDNLRPSFINPGTK
jgi:hypothetical protein